MFVIAIDFDGTANENVKQVNELYEDKNNFIVIHTSRSSNIRVQTEEELHVLGIRYHALVMDKMRADVYIDDKNAGGLTFFFDKELRNV